MTPSYVDTSASPSTTYSYTVRARDTSGNLSPLTTPPRDHTSGLEHADLRPCGRHLRRVRFPGHQLRLRGRARGRQQPGQAPAPQVHGQPDRRTDGAERELRRTVRPLALRGPLLSDCLQLLERVGGQPGPAPPRPIPPRSRSWARSLPAPGTRSTSPRSSPPTGRTACASPRPIRTGPTTPPRRGRRGSRRGWSSPSADGSKR